MRFRRTLLRPALSLALAATAAAPAGLAASDAYAWSLANTGDDDGAAAEMRPALAFGLKDPKVLQHAQAIAEHGTGE